MRSLLLFVVLLAMCSAAPAGQAPANQPPSDQSPLYAIEFSSVGYGQAPDGWTDLAMKRPSRNWAVDGQGFVRVMLKNATGMLAYDGALADGGQAEGLRDVALTAALKKTEDPDVAFGLLARVKDKDNAYLARFVGDSRLELVRIQDGKEQVLGHLPTLKRYRHGDAWTMSLAARGDVLTATISDEAGIVQARVDGKDDAFNAGRVGLHCTTFASAKTFEVRALDSYDQKLSAEQIVARNAQLAAGEPRYPVVKPVDDVEPLNTPFDSLADDYDVVIAGGGTSGWGAAVQAARMGAKVLLLEETDWLGGQMAAAAVTTMDEDSVHRQFPVRERGIYREFHESMVAYYYTLDKDPFLAYYAHPQTEGGYEPRLARAVLYGFIQEARSRGATLDVSIRSRVVKVQKQGEAITGATIEFLNEDGSTRQRQVASRILVDATEYGDVIPLTGARYRVGNITSDKLDPAAPVQDHTWTAVIREYPQGVPDHLKIKSPPPGYEEYGAKRYRKFQHAGLSLWGTAGKGIKGPRTFRVFLAWRGMADTSSPLIGEPSELRHTRCGINGGNDYPVSVGTIEDPAQRNHDERFGIYRTLQAVYYFQHELGLNWALAEDEGYNTPYNRWKMKQLDLEPDMEAVAVYLPQMPYVRESRRIIGIRTLVAHDLSRYENAKLMPTSLAMGDYFMDLHRTEEALETELDSPGYAKGGGPFQVPFEAFIPERLDGFLPAEKNFSQSRLVSGATRLQPITMLTGQAVGAMAALAVKQNVQPRQLDAKQVQAALLESGSTLIQRWYNDVQWGTPLWRATQLLSLYQVMDRPGPVGGEFLPLGAKASWGVDRPLTRDEMQAALKRLAEIKSLSSSPRPESAALASSTAGEGDGVSAEQVKQALAQFDAAWAEAFASGGVNDASKVTAGEFALAAARILVGGSAQ